jgi:hypothetical protein
MTPREKAEELVSSMEHWLGEGNSIAKQCALIAVDEIIEVLRDLGYDNEDNRMIYHLEVKQEIEKL